MEYIKLNNGDRIPAAGMGTFLMEPDDAEKAVLSALQNGYRLIDTANGYLNEKAVGRAIRASGLPREELYLSTKLWPSVYVRADEAIDETLERLGLDYVNLLFLHQPVGEIEHAYEAMERAVKAGKVRALGLSNFSAEQIRELSDKMEIRPAVIQVEAHPYYPQTKLQEELSDIGAVIMAWYPLGHGDKSLIQEPVFTELSAKYGKSNAQIILRWHIQSGQVVIPGSKNPDHIRANLNLFDFQLTEDEMAAIAKVDKNVRYYTATESALQGYLIFAPDFNAQK